MNYLRNENMSSIGLLWLSEIYRDRVAFEDDGLIAYILALREPY